MGRPIGKCRLCLAGNAELCDSHILPKFGYKRIRGKEGATPAHLDGKVAFQTDKQLTEYLLCRSCEDLFMKVETRWARLVHKDDEFPIHEQLGIPTSDGVDPAGRQLGSVSREDAIYLAASVVWRGSVASSVQTHLGPYEEDFRLFLLGNREFPKHAEVVLQVLGPKKTEQLPEMYQVIVPPWTERKGQHHLHRFILCGCLFATWVGGQLPTSLAHHGLVRGIEPLVLIGQHDGFVKILGNQILSAKPKGKLAKLRPTRP